jgi:hypothetical protein
MLIQPNKAPSRTPQQQAAPEVDAQQSQQAQEVPEPAEALVIKQLLDSLVRCQTVVKTRRNQLFGRRRYLLLGDRDRRRLCRQLNRQTNAMRVLFCRATRNMIPPLCSY